jgi:hypothetical protein
MVAQEVRRRIAGKKEALRRPRERATQRKYTPLSRGLAEYWKAIAKWPWRDDFSRVRGLVRSGEN